MYPEFAYSRWMQLILAVVSTVSAHIFVYLIADLILTAYGEKASRKQKHIFAFWVGVVLNQMWAYGIYFLGGMLSFSRIIYLLVVSPNPVFALLYLFTGIKVLKLSPIRSIKLMGHVFLYYMIIKSFNRLIGSIFFVQPPGRYNYMIDVFQQSFLLIITLIIFFATLNILIRNKNIIKLTDGLFINLKKELVIYFLKSVIIYILMVFLPVYMSEKLIAANLIVLIILILGFALTLTLDIYSSTKKVIENREAHINVLSRGIDDFGSVKHDFYNILQTYGGYIEIGDLEDLKKYHASLLHLTTSAGSVVEFGQRMSENPALISLLMAKKDYAAEMNVDMRVTLQSNLDDLYIDNMEICRVIACLLDNAIEAAAVSEQRKVSFTIYSKGDFSKLIVITNGTAEHINTNGITSHGITSKKGHQGIGLTTVRRTIEKYGNCTFQLAYYNYELSAYIEIKR